MKRLLPGKILLVSFFCAVAIAACNTGNGPKASPGRSPAAVRGGGGGVWIAPENPTSADNLAVQVSGASSVTFRWERNGEPIEGTHGAVLNRSLFRRGDVVTLKAVIDGVAREATVHILNSPPVVESLSLSPEFICRGTDITAKPTASDPDGDEVRFGYTWIVNGREMPDDSLVLKGDRFRAGDKVSLKVTPFDGRDKGKPFISQSVVIPNGYPVFVSVPPTDFRGRVYHYDAKAIDPDGDSLSYSLISAPPGMTIDGAKGSVMWHASEDSALENPVEIGVEDSVGGRSFQKFMLRVPVTQEDR